MDSGKYDIATTLGVPRLGKNKFLIKLCKQGVGSPCIRVNRTLRHPCVSLTTGSVTLPNVSSIQGSAGPQILYVFQRSDWSRRCHVILRTSGDVTRCRLCDGIASVTSPCDVTPEVPPSAARWPVTSTVTCQSITLTWI